MTVTRPDIKNLGIIAGNRSLPLLLAQNARKMGVQHITAVAFENETDPRLAQWVDTIVWLRVGQLTRMLDAFTRNGVRHCVMAGQIAPKNLFEVRPDLRAMVLLWKLKEKNAHTVFGAVADELKRAGVELIDATPWLEPLMAHAGLHLGGRLSASQREDVAFGFKLAKEVSRLEIGQTVVVKEGTILAVEGFEGTDQCLTRGGQLAGKSGGAVAVKVAKPNHDMRWDIPCVGPQTIQVCVSAGVAVLAVEPGKTLLLEREVMETDIRRHGFVLTTVDPS
jgi:DUF1009 family protein